MISSADRENMLRCNAELLCRYQEAIASIVAAEREWSLLLEQALRDCEQVAKSRGDAELCDCLDARGAYQSPGLAALLRPNALAASALRGQG